MATTKKASTKKTGSRRPAAIPAKAKGRAAKAIGLHLGLNAVSAAHYDGWSGELTACEQDALDMSALAKGQGMQPKTLLTTRATRAAILRALRAAAKRLVKGDLFFLSYSGHGGRVKDVSGDEPDKKDETWCLYDGQLIDDELYLELSRFAAGVRVVVLSDSCHSGSVTRAGPPSGEAVSGRSRMMPTSVAERVYAKHQAYYDKLQRAVVKAAGKSGVVDPDAALSSLSLQSGRVTAIVNKFKPSAVLISGCQDNQTSADGPRNGAFTERLLKVWDQGRFVGNYVKFHGTIVAGMPSSQTPNLFTLGPVAKLLAQQPFKV